MNINHFQKWRRLFFLFLMEIFLSTAALPSVAIFLNTGANVSQLHNTVSVMMNDTLANTYHFQEQQRWGVIAGGGIAWLFHPNNHFQILVGPAAYFLDFDNVRGVESPFSNVGSFDTLNYQFFVNSTALFLESRFISTVSSWQPVIAFGVGNAWNYLFRYSEVPTDPNGGASSATSVFVDKTQSAVAYEIGLGVQHQLFADKKRNIIYQVGLNYRYFNLGAGKLGSSSLQTTKQALSLSPLQSQTILLALSVIFH